MLLSPRQNHSKDKKLYPLVWINTFDFSLNSDLKP